MRTLYTPMLVLSVLMVLRALLTFRPRIAFHRERVDTWSGSVLIAGGDHFWACCSRPCSSRSASACCRQLWRLPPTYWRSSPPGIDLLASLLLPNPNHPLWGSRCDG